MIEWPIIFLGGLLGSSHCVGMCGAFALTIGVQSVSPRANLLRQSSYTLGRIFTSSFGGAAAGLVGLKLQRLSAAAFNAQAILALAAGALLVFQGLSAAGLLPRFRRNASAVNCPATGLFSSFLTAPGLANSFFAGLLTGFLPCGLVYAYLVLAAGTGSLPHGAAIMALFGAGTAPLMILTGVGTALLSVTWRSRLLRLAALCVVVTGLITFGRGISWARSSSTAAAPTCPFCESPQP